MKINKKNIREKQARNEEDKFDRKKRRKEKLDKKIDDQIKFAWEKAMKDPFPSKKSILEFVYSKN